MQIRIEVIDESTSAFFHFVAQSGSTYGFKVVSESPDVLHFETDSDRPPFSIRIEDRHGKDVGPKTTICFESKNPLIEPLAWVNKLLVNSRENAKNIGRKPKQYISINFELPEEEVIDHQAFSSV